MKAEIIKETSPYFCFNKIEQRCLYHFINNKSRYKIETDASMGYQEIGMQVILVTYGNIKLGSFHYKDTGFNLVVRLRSLLNKPQTFQIPYFCMLHLRFDKSDEALAYLNKNVKHVKNLIAQEAKELLVTELY